MKSHRKKKGWEFSFAVQDGQRSKGGGEVCLLPALVGKQG